MWEIFILFFFNYFCKRLKFTVNEEEENAMKRWKKEDEKQNNKIDEIIVLTLNWIK